MRTLSHIVPRVIGILLCAGSITTHAQTSTKVWSGVWQAQGTPFTLRVTRQNDQLHIEPVESLGFIWSNSVGKINGESATVEVNYQGVVGTILVQLGEGDTAMVRPLSCQPDYHVVCALVQNQQARFVRIDAAGAQTADASNRNQSADMGGN
ncbi:MAG: hypothetical protein Q8L60_00775 [Gammaproteobacteria bacterium]|nr:hypothetical protein [Gammaproteobacteria bacterium]MDP2348411.1 hypothetical protein [Gammaproteobacteria bacterium]